MSAIMDESARAEQRRWADEAFAEFWAIYPRRVGKIAARKAWDKARPTPELLEKIKNALSWQVEDWDDPQFIPYPKTWINQGRWDDEPPQRAPKNGSPSAIEPYHWKACTHTPKCGSSRECNVRKATKKVAS